MWRKGNPSTLLMGMQNWCSHCGKQYGFPQKTKNGTAFDPAIPLLGLYPKNPETPIQKNLCTPMFIAAQFTIAKCWKQPRYPSVNEWIKWNSVQQKERRSSTLCDSMDGTGEHYAKWNKPSSERQIPYNLTFNRNLINKTSQEYNQRHWNWEQADGEQRGEGRELQGKRVKGLLEQL